MNRVSRSSGHVPNRACPLIFTGVDIHPYYAVADFDWVSPNAGQVGVRANAPVQIERPMMPRTRHHVSGHVAARQVPAGMRTAIVDHDDALRVGQPKNSKFTIAHGRKRPTVETASR